MKEFDLLSHEKISDRLYIVRESYFAKTNLNIGVVLGDDWTMVIDSGMGVTHGLRKYIETYITDKKPMKCYLTHGHIDHCSGAPLFDEIHMHPADWVNRDWEENIERRFSDLRGFCANNEELMEFCRDKYVEPSRDYILDVEDGDVIDLGGIAIEVFSIPGHSPGSVAYLDRQDHVVFVGDQISDHGNGAGGNKTIAETIRTLRVFAEAMPEDVRIYHGHSRNPFGTEVVDSIIEALEDIVAGRTWDDELDTKRHGMENPDRPKKIMRKHFVNGLFVSYDAEMYPSAKRE